MNSRWSQFRASEDSIPEHPYEAGVFLQNARLHLINADPLNWEARKIIGCAHDEVNKHFFTDREVA
jgi:hypothetical protein